MNIEELVTFIDGRSQGFRQRIRPIPAALLAEVEAEAGRPLPSLYREYLLRMGGDSAELKRPRWDLDPRAVVGEAQVNRAYPRPRFIMMGLHRAGPLEPAENWFFDGDTSDRVVRFETIDPQIQHVTSTFSSFEELLVDWTARIFLFAKDQSIELQLPRTVEVDGRQPDDGHTLCRELLRRMGFRQQLASTRDLWLGCANETTWALVQNLPDPDTYSFFVLLAGPERARVAATLKDNLDDPDADE